MIFGSRPGRRRKSTDQKAKAAAVANTPSAAIAWFISQPSRKTSRPDSAAPCRASAGTTKPLIVPAMPSATRPSR